MKLKLSFLRLWLQIGFLLLAVVTLYVQSLHNPFVFDDLDFEGLSQYWHLANRLSTRWLSNTSLGWTVHVFGFDIYWLRLGNVLLHAANTIALFFLLRKLFQITLTNTTNFNENFPTLAGLAFFAALIFALHPISIYGVAYLIQRSILMAMLFSLLMLITYLQGLIRGSWHWMFGASLLYFAAVLSKEHSIAAPAVAAAMTLLIRKPSLELFKQTAPFYILCTIIAVAITYMTNKAGIIASAYEPNGAGIVELSASRQGITTLPNSYLLSIETQSFLFFKYLLLWLIPNPAWISVDMRESFAVSLLSWPQLLGWVGFPIYFCIAIWLLLKRGGVGLLGFALISPWLLFLTELTTVRAQEPFVLYRSYLWMPFLLTALPVIFVRFAPTRTYILLGILATLLIPLSINRLNTFSSSLLLWDDAEKLVYDKHNTPGVERIYANRGHEFGTAKRYREAIADFTTAISIYPNYDTFYSDRATAYYFLGKYQEALRDYNHAIALNNQNPISYNGRALTYQMLNDESSAQADFEQGCTLGLCPPKQSQN